MVDTQSGNYYCRTIKETDLICNNMTKQFTNQPIIDKFLFEEALESIVNNHYNTTGVFSKENDTLVAFFVLHLEDVKTVDFSEEEKKKLTKEELKILEQDEEDSLRSRVRLAYLGVHHGEKKKGIGSYIINKVVRVARRLSTDEVFVEALVSAYKFYEKQGFEKLIPDKDIRDYESVDMVKYITPYEPENI